MNKFIKRYLVIIIVYITIIFIPTIILLNKLPENERIFLIMIMMICWIFGLLLTPWTYRKVFNKNKF